MVLAPAALDRRDPVLSWTLLVEAVNGSAAHPNETLEREAVPEFAHEARPFGRLDIGWDVGNPADVDHRRGDLAALYEFLWKSEHQVPVKLSPKGDAPILFSDWYDFVFLEMRSKVRAEIDEPKVQTILVNVALFCVL